MEMAKLKSMDVTIRGVTQTFEFAPPEDFGEGDEAEVSMSALEEAETTEVELVSGISSAEVLISGTVTYEVEFRYTVEDLDDENVKDEDDVQDHVEGLDLESEAEEAASNGNYTTYDFRVNDISVEDMLDENGNSVEL
jgi:hypothetical protein